MAVTAESFRWLDILEKEFDKAFVDLDLLIDEGNKMEVETLSAILQVGLLYNFKMDCSSFYNFILDKNEVLKMAGMKAKYPQFKSYTFLTYCDLDSDEPEMVYNARQKMATLSSCFAQLTHKAQTIFQNNAKNEAELVNMRAELVETKTRSQCLEEELHAVLVQLHTTQLQHINNADDGMAIKNKLQQGLVLRSPTHRASLSGIKLDALVMSLENWKCRLELENESLRHALVSLQAEVCGARLAARYLDKELAGRIQQLQLLGRSDMTGDVRNRLWSQLESEILLQRHKTVMRAVRQADHRAPPVAKLGNVRTIELHRRPDQGLGISITGGREHGVPILISELEPGGDTQDLYVGDSVLSVNGIDLTQASHKEAVSLLSSQTGNVTLRVQYLSAGGDDSEEDNDLANLRYRFFEDLPEGTFYRMNGFAEGNKKGGGMLVTPTAPRTPDSSVRGESECSYPSSPTAESQPSTAENKAPTPPTVNPTPHLSPRNFGVTTLQKIFRSLTPSGVWAEGVEDKVISVSEKTDNDSVAKVQDLTVQPVSVETAVTAVTAAAESPRPIEVQDSPKIHGARRTRATSQVFHPETEATMLVDGVGDASFGTPV